MSFRSNIYEMMLEHFNHGQYKFSIQGAAWSTLRQSLIGLRIVKSLQQSESLALKYKEVAWLYKTAYNTCFQALNSWDLKEKLVEMMDVSVEVSSVISTLVVTFRGSEILRKSSWRSINLCRAWTSTQSFLCR